MIQHEYATDLVLSPLVTCQFTLQSADLLARRLAMNQQCKTEWPTVPPLATNVLICTSLNLIYQWVNEPWRVGVNQGVLQTKAPESCRDATPRLTSVLFWGQHDGNGMVFTKIKSPEPCHSPVATHSHFTQKSKQVVSKNKAKHRK